MPGEVTTAMPPRASGCCRRTRQCAAPSHRCRAVAVGRRGSSAFPQIPEETAVDDVGLVAAWSRDAESPHCCREMLRRDEATRALGRYPHAARVRSARTQRTRCHAAVTARACHRGTAIDARLSSFSRDSHAIHHHTQYFFQPDYQADWSTNPSSSRSADYDLFCRRQLRQ